MISHRTFFAGFLSILLLIGVNLVVPLISLGANASAFFSSVVTQLNYHPINNYIRLGALVLLPSLVFIGVSRTVRPLFVSLHSPIQRSDLVFWIVSTLYLVLTVNILRQSLLPPTYQPVDFYHDGIFLSPVVEWLNGNRYSQNSFFHYGPLYEQVIPLLFGGVQGKPSLGSLRILFHLLQSGVWISLSGFIFVAALAIRKSAGGFSAALALLLFTTVHLFRWRTAQYTDPREAINGLVVTYLLYVVIQPGRFRLFFLGLATCPLMLFSMDRGIFFAVLCCAVLVSFCIRRRERCARFSRVMLPYLLGLGTSALLTFLVLGPSLSLTLIQNVAEMNRWYDWMMSSPFPVLGFGNPEHVLLVASLVVCLVGLWSVWRSPMADQRLVALAIVFTLAPLLYLRSVIAIPDRHHVIYSSTYAHLGVGFYIWWFFQGRPWKESALVISLLILIANPLNEGIRLFKGSHTWSKDIHLLLSSMQTPDEVYLDVETRMAIARLKTIFKSEKCLSVFANTPAMYYLLNKPACSRFHVPVFASPPDFQREWIADLKRQQPQRIIFASPYREYNNFDGVSMSDRLPMLAAYLKMSYIMEIDVNGWLVYRRQT